MKSPTLPNGYSVAIMDSNDGTGDGLIPLSDDLLKSSNWKIGDLLTIEVWTTEKL